VIEQISVAMLSVFLCETSSFCTVFYQCNDYLLAYLLRFYTVVGYR